MLLTLSVKDISEIMNGKPDATVPSNQEEENENFPEEMVGPVRSAAASSATFPGNVYHSNLNSLSSDQLNQTDYESSSSTSMASQELYSRYLLENYIRQRENTENERFHNRLSEELLDRSRLGLQRSHFSFASVPSMDSIGSEIIRSSSDSHLGANNQAQQGFGHNNNASTSLFSSNTTLMRQTDQRHHTNRQELLEYLYNMNNRITPSLPVRFSPNLYYGFPQFGSELDSSALVEQRISSMPFINMNSTMQSLSNQSIAQLDTMSNPRHGTIRSTFAGEQKEPNRTFPSNEFVHTSGNKDETLVAQQSTRDECEDRTLQHVQSSSKKRAPLPITSKRNEIYDLATLRASEQANLGFAAARAPIHDSKVDGDSSSQTSSTEESRKKRRKRANHDDSGVVKPNNEKQSLESSRFGYNPGKLIPLSIEKDESNLSQFQRLLRKQIYFFEASTYDLQCSAQGRNKPISIGQVGIVCRHCSSLPPGLRPSGSVYFPAKLDGLYQASQNMTTNHLIKSCLLIPEETRTQLFDLKFKKSIGVGGGKEYWATGAKFQGVIQTDEGLKFAG